MKYNLDIENRHKENNLVVDTEFIKLRKKINKKIFQSIEIWLENDPNRYYIGKRISESIFEYENEWALACYFGINLKRSLGEGYRVCLNTLIENEYSHILKLENENDNLKRELEFYKKLALK